MGGPVWVWSQGGGGLGGGALAGAARRRRRGQPEYVRRRADHAYSRGPLPLPLPRSAVVAGHELLDRPGNQRRNFQRHAVTGSRQHAGLGVRQPGRELSTSRSVGRAEPLSLPERRKDSRREPVGRSTARPEAEQASNPGCGGPATTCRWRGTSPRTRNYPRWRNANARHRDVLAAERKERARIRSETGIRWGGRPLKAAA